MAVYTRVDSTDLQHLLGQYDIGSLVDFTGISAGVTNTNYFVDTTDGRWVLTLFEQAEAAADLPFFMQLMDHLARHHIPCAHPVARRDGNFLSTLRGRRAALVYCLQGHSLSQPEPAHCQSLGRVVADMHRAAADFVPQRDNTRGLAWIARAAEQLQAVLPTAEYNLLAAELKHQQQAEHALYAALPQAVVHADLFRDNVLFTGHQVAGVIDFYYACHERLLFDLAVICNDWAFSDEGRFLAAHWQALMHAYTHQRPLTASEQRAWPAMLRAAALRFWVSRLIDAHFPTAGEDVQIKDPAPFRELLLRHQHTPPELEPT